MSAVSVPLAGSRPVHDGSRAGRSLVIAAVVLLITIRLFTDVLGVLPGPMKLVDVGLLAVMLIAASLQPAAAQRRPGGFGAIGTAFLAVCTISVIANPSRIAIGPVLLFLYGVLGPLAFYYAARRLWPSGSAGSLSRVLVGLALLQFVVVAFIDLPKFLATGNPDYMSGTFGENAYQLVFFLVVAVALVAAVATFEPRRPVARVAPLFIMAALLVVFLAQYRALLLSAAASVILVAVLLQQARGPARRRAVMVALVAGCAFVASLGFVTLQFRSTKFEPYVAALRANSGSFVTQRVQALGAVHELYDDEQTAMAFGTGPGTFSSRAWLTFANYPTKRAASDPVARAVSAVTNGEGYRTDVSDRYVMPRYTTARAVLGSRSINLPFSSYTSLLAEVGIVGFLLIVGIYARALVRSVRMTLVATREATRGDSLPGLLLASTVAFFVLLQMAFLDNWLEVMRITVPAWILLAVATKEFEARYEGDRT